MVIIKFLATKMFNETAYKNAMVRFYYRALENDYLKNLYEGMT